MKYTSKFEEMLDDIFVDNGPMRISKNVRTVIVEVVPWLLALSAIFQLVFVWNNRFGSLIEMVLNGSIAVLYLLAFTKLLKLQKEGWNLIYYSCLIGLLLSLYHTVQSGSFIITLGFMLITQYITFYLLFQIRSEFTGKA